MTIYSILTDMQGVHINRFHELVVQSTSVVAPAGTDGGNWFLPTTPNHSTYFIFYLEMSCPLLPSCSMTWFFICTHLHHFKVEI